MKRLLTMMLAIIFVITAFVSCAKMKEIEDASGSESFSDGNIGSDLVIENSTDNILPEGGENNGDSVGNGTGNGEDATQTKPTFDVKESTKGLKFELNDDKLGYTLVDKGTVTAKDIVVDGYNGLPVTKIGHSAFESNTLITSVKLGDYVEVVDDYAFSLCTNLQTVTFGKGVKVIGDYAFKHCYGITNLTLGKNVEYIKCGAFYKSKNLATITIYDNVRSIEEYAFEGTKYYDTTGNWKNNVLYIGNHLIKAKSAISGNYTVAANTKTIAEKAFLDRSSLTGIVIPDSVHGIGVKAFQNATKLTSITMGKGVELVGEKAFDNTGFYNASANWKNNVLYIGSCLVSAKAALSGSYTITSGTKCIADMAFNNCINLAGVVIPDTVSHVGEYAFNGCEKLVSVTVGSAVKEIGVFAFKGCSAIKAINVKKTTGWTADKLEITSEQITDKEQAALYIGIVYSDKVWTRA